MFLQTESLLFSYIQNNECLCWLYSSSTEELKHYSSNSHLAGLYLISGSEDSYLVEFYLGCLHHDKQCMYFQQCSFVIAINLKAAVLN